MPNLSPFNYDRAGLVSTKSFSFTDDRPPQSLPPLLSWKEVSKNFPWGTILLIGGGTVLVDTIKVRK